MVARSGQERDPEPARLRACWRSFLRLARLAAPGSQTLHGMGIRRIAVHSLRGWPGAQDGSRAGGIERIWAGVPVAAGLPQANGFAMSGEPTRRGKALR